MELWIGLVELKPLKQGERKWAGAFTNIVTWATDERSFRKKAKIVAATIDMYVVDVEKVEPVRARFKDRAMDADIEDMVQRAETNPNAIIYGTFHTYPHDTA